MPGATTTTGFLPKILLLAVLAASSIRIASAAPWPPVNDAPPSHGRHRGCGVHIPQERVTENERLFQTHRLAPETEDATAVIDVIFHIIYANKTDAGGFVKTSRILEQLKVLNDDYKDAKLTWKLSNITRIQNERWFNALAQDSNEDQSVKEQLRQGGASTLNVYTVGFNEGNMTGTLGYATFPVDYQKAPKKDGIVLLHSTIPNPGREGPAPHNFTMGRTLVHEAGHWLGLYHTFQGGCSGSGDEVDDTPAEASPAYGCPVKRDTCPSPGEDPVTNFMDYTDDACMKGFTKGQIKRIRAQLRTYREVKFTVPEKPEERR